MKFGFNVTLPSLDLVQIHSRVGADGSEKRVLVCKDTAQMSCIPKWLSERREEHRFSVCL